MIYYIQKKNKRIENFSFLVSNKKIGYFRININITKEKIEDCLLKSDLEINTNTITLESLELYNEMQLIKNRN